MAAKKHSEQAPAGSETDQPPPPLPPLKASPIPLVAVKEEESFGSDGAPYIPDERFTDGIWTRRSDGEDYALCIHEPYTYGQTHMARNSQHQWEGVSEQFHAEFTKK